MICASQWLYVRGHCINTSCRKWWFFTHPPCHAWSRFPRPSFFQFQVLNRRAHRPRVANYCLWRTESFQFPVLNRRAPQNCLVWNRNIGIKICMNAGVCRVLKLFWICCFPEPFFYKALRPTCVGLIYAHACVCNARRTRSMFMDISITHAVGHVFSASF